MEVPLFYVFAQGEKISTRHVSDRVNFLEHRPAHVLSRKKILLHNVLDLFPLTYMCVDINFRSFND